MRIGSLWCTLCLLLATTLPGATALRRPVVGLIRQTDRSVWLLYGTTANFVRGEQALTQVEAASFSNTSGVLFRNGQLQIVSDTQRIMSSTAVDEAAPLVTAGTEGAPHLAWLPVHQQFAVWTAGRFRFLPSDVDHVLAISPVSADEAQVLSAIPGGGAELLLVSLSSGLVLNRVPTPGVSGSATIWKNRILFHDGESMVLATVDGRDRQRLSINASDAVAERMSDDWLQLSSRSQKQHWALHWQAGAVEVSELPAEAGN